ncbi:hypothetical protein [Qipengyuania gaetbuli]|uniref:hypothetical protein n=1 Tax=Qipengyuania gaetbuli TaxID=266952 RepID=UPI001CFEB875|nr:hypothetical protein [Qipengyuania gaetbuli]
MRFLFAMSCLMLAGSVHSQALAQADTCQSYIGQTLQTQSFDEVWNSLPSVSPQGEYESNAAYEARIGTLDPRPPVWIRRSTADKQKIGSFDPKIGALKVSDFALSTYMPFGFGYKLNLPKPSNAFGFAATDYGRTYDEPYEASNALGAKTTVTVAVDWIDLVIATGNNEKGREWDIPSESYAMKYWNISGTPDRLKEISESGNYVWLVAPVKKAGENLREQTSFAKFNNPVDRSVVAKRVLLADFMCAGLIDRSGVVLQASPIKSKRF